MKFFPQVVRVALTDVGQVSQEDTNVGQGKHCRGTQRMVVIVLYIVPKQRKGITLSRCHSLASHDLKDNFLHVYNDVKEGMGNLYSYTCPMNYLPQ